MRLHVNWEFFGGKKGYGLDEKLVFHHVSQRDLYNIYHGCFEFRLDLD